MVCPLLGVRADGTAATSAAAAAATAGPVCVKDMIFSAEMELL